MTQAEIWEGFETGRGPFFRLLRLVMIAVGIVALFFFGSLSLSWPQQAVLGLLIVVVLGIIFGATVTYHALTHETTDDAYTTGHVHNIASRVTGTVLNTTSRNTST